MITVRRFGAAERILLIGSSLKAVRTRDLKKQCARKGNSFNCLSLSRLPPERAAALEGKPCTSPMLRLSRHWSSPSPHQGDEEGNDIEPEEEVCGACWEP